MLPGLQRFYFLKACKMVDSGEEIIKKIEKNHKKWAA